MKSLLGILLPINIANCPLEVFPYVNQLNEKFNAALTLLHVVQAERADGNGVTEDQIAGSRSHLDGLARRFLNLNPRLKIRVGRIPEAILDEAKEQRADLIILTSHGNSSPGARAPQPDIGNSISREAPCRVSVLHVRTHFNCEEQWPLVEEIVAALDYVGLLKPSNARQIKKSQFDKIKQNSIR